MSPWLLPALATAAVVGLGAAVEGARRTSRAGSARARLQGSVPAPPPWFAEVLAALEVPIPPHVAWPWAMRASAGAALVLAVRSPALVAVALGVGTAVVAGGRMRAGRASEREVDRALPALIDDVVAAMASGSSLRQGLVVAAERPGPVGRELRDALRLQARGSALQDVLDGWAGTRPGSGLVLVADALALAGATGGSQVAALQRVGTTLREREARHREVQAMAAQAQLSALVLAVTPVAFAAVVAVLDHRIAAFLLASPLGWACLIGGLALDGAGAWWMRRLVRSVS